MNQIDMWQIVAHFVLGLISTAVFVYAQNKKNRYWVRLTTARQAIDTLVIGGGCALAFNLVLMLGITIFRHYQENTQSPDFTILLPLAASLVGTLVVVVIRTTKAQLLNNPK